MPRAALSDSEEEDKKVASNGKRATRTESPAEENANDGGDSSEEDENKEEEYEIEAILQMRQGVFGPVRALFLTKTRPDASYAVLTSSINPRGKLATS